jgi:translation initiation factor 1
MARNKKDEGTVYSTDQGTMCPDCGMPVSECSCSSNEEIPDRNSKVKITRETKGRKGKGVTVITGLPLATSELKPLAKKLKQKCGTGGAVKNRTIEIQGDHRETLMAELKKLGFNV